MRGGEVWDWESEARRYMDRCIDAERVGRMAARASKPGLVGLMIAALLEKDQKRFIKEKSNAQATSQAQSRHLEC